jgi:integrase/recombinase XerD
MVNPAATTERNRGNPYSLETLVTGYRVTMKAEGITEKYVRDVEGNTMRLHRFLVSSGYPTDIRDIGVAEIRAYLAQLLETPRYLNHNLIKHSQGYLTRTTVNNYGRALSSFWSWAYREEIIETNVFKRLKLPKPDSKTVDIFTESQLQALFSAIDPKTAIGARDRAILMLMIDTGLRDAECRGLTIANTDLEQMTIRIMGKGRRERVIPFGNRTQKALWSYIAFHRRKHAGSRAETVFVSRYGKPLAGDRIRAQLRYYGQKAGITGVRCSPHTCRHTFASKFLENGGDVFSLQHILGHRSLDMVRRYVRLALGTVCEAHRRYSPADNLAIN